MTMEMFNKIYSQVSSSVSSTVSQLSGVLPGNPVTREFEANCHIASAGPSLLWKVYKGTKRSTKQEAAIFVFEKRQLERYSKTDRDVVIEALKRGVMQLTKIRHPQILTVQHPLEESRESLAFATEPIFASLANVLGKTKNMPQPSNLTDYKLFDIEVKYGLLQIGQGLTFLHNDMKMLHRNVSPDSIVINASGVWKIFGFDFCAINSSPPNSEPSYPFQQYQSSVPAEAQPSLDFLAPESVLSLKHSPSSDMYSLGMVAFILHSVGNRPLGGTATDIQQFKQRIKSPSPDKLQCLPDLLRHSVQKMLDTNPAVRPDAHSFVRIPYFEDVSVKTLNQLDSLLQWDNLQKSHFYKGLPEAMQKLPHRVRVQRVLPSLRRDLAQPVMVPFVLPSVLDIANNCEQAEYVAHVLPALKPVMKMLEPVQILLILLQRMELLLKLTPAEDIQQHVLPMLYRGLDSSAPQIHELCLTVLPTFAGLLDHSNVKNSLLPRIKKLCLATSTLSVRVNCLLCVGRLLEHLDKWLVIDEVLPFLPQIPSREPAVLMGILGIYKLAMTHKKLGISKEVLAGRVLPFLMPLCIENGLTLQQFNALVALVKQMVHQVESEHRSKLEQLNSVQEENKTLAATAATLPTVSSTNNNAQLDSAFTGLGLDNFAAASTPTKKPSVNVTSKSLEPSKNLNSLLEFSPNHANTVRPAASASPPPPINLTNQLQSPTLTSMKSPTIASSSSFNNVNSNWSSPVAINQCSSMNSNMNTFHQNANIVSPWAGNNVNSSQPFLSETRTDKSPQNWSALDNLLPKPAAVSSNGNSATRTSLNQMLTPSQPLLSSSQLKLTGQNTLSNDDILDLLN